MKSGQKGFTIVETLLVLILISILGFTGYYVYHSRNNAKSTYNNAASTNLSPTQTSAKADATAAENVVDNFYKSYIQASTDQESAQSQQPTKDVVAKYGTQKFIDFYSQSRAFDPVFCAQNMPDQEVTVTKSSAEPTGGVTVDVTQNYSGGSNIRSSVTVLGGKVDSITCPTSS